MATRTQILVRGIVQGVGFRPFVFTEASRRKLKGRVFNNTTGVVIDIEGESGLIEQFIEEIRSSPPPLSMIEAIERCDNLIPADYRDFLIVESDGRGERAVPISADAAVCGDCLLEMFNPADRRYRYPFINCTACGPRFTIVEDIPYDRLNTTMREFVMCEACLAEYSDPRDRRYHAEPTACWACGPRLVLVGPPGTGLEIEPEQCVDRAQTLLLGGAVLAVKGIGGFHLACDALNGEAVARLRSRKHREDKPFAMMAASIEAIREYCDVSDGEERMLSSVGRPIVVLARRPGTDIAADVAPGMNTLGFMLPYSPLHHLLLQRLERPLVMTSGNVSDEPISFEDADALDRLGRIADWFLLHNRRIHIRTDDSVSRVALDGGGLPYEMILRRSRGYAPAPVRTSFRFQRQILACGAELKNTFCLARENSAFISHHIGDLENLETFDAFTRGIEHFRRLFNLNPEVVAYDLHPEYLSTKYALSLDEEGAKVGVQHHHAHIASCMADNQTEGEVIGIAMDGLGFGTDGRLWGGEFFVADFATAERIAHLDYVPMPGGAQAIREPWRMAAVYLQRVLGDEFLNIDIPFVRKLDRGKWAALRSMTRSGTNSRETSSMGRLFDAVSALLCLKSAVNYEGQAAVELEAIADPGCSPGYAFEVSGSIIKPDGVIRRAVEDILDGVPPDSVSAKFHLGIASLIVLIARNIRDERRLNRVALSGGVFQNMFLLRHVLHLLRSDGFDVLTHSRVPPNDAGISLGQAAVANAYIKSGRI